MRRGRAFTLIETLLALAVIVALCGALFSLVFTLGDRRRTLETGAAQRSGLAVVLSRLGGDVACAIAGDPVLGPGVAGTDSSLRVLTRGVDLEAALRGGADAGADLLACEYRYESGAIVASRRAVGAGGMPEARPERACEGVRRVRFRYFNGRTWGDTFDSVAAGGLPAAIEVSVWAGPVVGDTDGPASPPDVLMVLGVHDGAGEEP